MTIKIKVVEWG